ncbi:MAG: DUF2478 domain-containing protein [Pseudorhodobacter sp.]|nr:DUF2478 domain-containing protein [Pseudorhodobacter sp.]
MLGYVVAPGRGAADQLLAEVAASLIGLGWPLAGVVQVNLEQDPAHPCQMNLQVLNGAQTVRISQDLGALSKGCRLDSAGLEQAVGLVETALEADPRLLIVNKFGRQELDGRGFRPLIGRAMAMGVPVLTAVNAEHLAGFEVFADGLGQALLPDPGTVLDWCRSHC